MASLFDVLDRLQEIAVAAVAPLQCSELVDVGQGWPIADGIDKAMAAGRVLVSIAQISSSTSNSGQIMRWDYDVMVPPVHGMTATAIANGFTLDGDPCIGEYATIILDGRHTYSYPAVAGDLVETVCAALVPQIAADYPGTARSGSSVTIPGFYDLVLRIGAPGVLAQQLHRQTQQIRIVTWAPTPALRAAVATVLDVAIKRNLKITLPDTSEAILTYQNLNLIDEYEKSGTFRGDLIFAAMWDTYDTFPGYEVTAVKITLDAGVGQPVSANI